MLATGCMSTAGRTVYPSSQVAQTLRVEVGTILGVRDVVIDGTSTQVGMYGGGALGAAGASGIGRGTGSAIASAGGFLGGMIVGRQVEKMVTRKEGLEITIALDNGQTVVVVQEKKKGGFVDGDRVRVLIGQDTAIVAH